MSLSRRRFGNTASTSAARTATGATGVPRVSRAANTAYVFGHFAEPPIPSAADHGPHPAVGRDGPNRSPLNRNNLVVIPTAGQQGLRDPQLYRELDATLCRVAGPADGGRSSFRSYDFPAHHPRHQGYVLHIDPISASSSATDRQDATFRVTS